MTDEPVDTDLRERIETYYDAVPRIAARAEDFGSLTLFAREGEGWPFYARPTLGWTGPFEIADVQRVRARQRELQLPESFEWVAETTPALRAAVEASGLSVQEHPVMVLDANVAVPATRSFPGGDSVRIVGPDDPVLAAVLAVGRLAFTNPGTGAGAAGEADLAAAVANQADNGAVVRMAARIRAGLSVAAAATDGTMVRCAGYHQPLGAVSEIVGVGTLPSARRRGLALAVSTALVHEARRRGTTTLFLSAADHDVARIYGRLGFRPIATALIAEPPGPA